MKIKTTILMLCVFSTSLQASNTTNDQPSAAAVIVCAAFTTAGILGALNLQNEIITNDQQKHRREKPIKTRKIGAHKPPKTVAHSIHQPTKSGR